MKQFVLRESSFLWIKGDEGCLYNTKDYTSFCFKVSDSFIFDVCKQWSNLDNLYKATFDEIRVSDAFLSFASAVEEHRLAKVYGADEPVISFPPALSIRDSIERLHKFDDLYDHPVLHYLLCLRVFLGGQGDGRPWWRQIQYPMDTPTRLDADRLFGFLHRCNMDSLTHIDLAVGEWDKGQLNAFAEMLSILNLKKKARFYFAHPNPGFRNEMLDSLLTAGFTVTQVCPPDEEPTTADWSTNRNYYLLVRNNEEYTHWKTLLEHDASDNYEFKPIAENNIDFFRDNVFLSEEEILNQKLSKKDIFRHQELNLNQFGTLFVYPDGTIHSSADSPTIGTLEDSVRQTIIRELEENHAWRQTRRLMSPCKDCLYHDLCPSPSVYERILGSPACTVKRPGA